MKKSCMIVLALLACLPESKAQYQLPNGGFEQWDGSSVTAEPTHWNSFATSDGTYASLASSPHHYHRAGGRPGSSGSSYLTIYSKSIIGVKANGNMTTGRIHAGSMSASGSENYNYTQRSNSDHCQPFSGTPDSMYVWVSFYAASSDSYAQVKAILHGDNDFRSPGDEATASMFTGKADATFARTTSSASMMQWQQIRVPFDYSGSAQPAYMLINLTTNATAGGGDANDSLSIDDIEFIYSAWLNGIAVDGVPVEGFDKGVFDYNVHVDDLEAEVSGITEASDATLAISRQQVDDTTVLVTLDVTAEDGVTTRCYHLTLTTGLPSVSIAGIAAAPRLRVYPNPTADAMTVEADGRVEVCDMRGRVLWHRDVCGTTQVSLSTLPAGVYVVRCGGSATKVTKR